MPYMVIERIGSCNDCNLCSEKRVVLPSTLICGVGFNPMTATPSPQYRICSIRFRIKSWDFVEPIPDVDIIGMKFANLITITSGDRDIFPSEFTVERQGSCLKCGFCCGYRNKVLTEYGCPHVIITGAKKGECSIYESLSDFCIEHGHTHEDCIPPPSHPNRFGNQDCGYRFIVTTPGLPITGNEVLRFYYIPQGQLSEPDSWVRDELID